MQEVKAFTRFMRSEVADRRNRPRDHLISLLIATFLVYWPLESTSARSRLCSGAS